MLTRIKNALESTFSFEKIKTDNYSEANFLETLVPYDISQNKVRLGPSYDGGYICSEYVLKNCAALFTYGVGNEMGFEEDFVKNYNKPAYLFDHTTGFAPFKKGLIEFFREGLGSGENCKDFFQHMEELKIKKPILLKIDIEGGEFDYFENIDMKKFKSLVMGLIIEIHWIDGLERRQKFLQIFNKLNPYFVLNHIHGNNWGGDWHFRNHVLPVINEFSFVNRKYVNSIKVDNTDYPISGLDYPNNPNKEDIALTFLKSI